MKNQPPTPRIALVYDRVNTPYGGAENVLLALHELYPTAPLFTAVYDQQRARWADVFQVQSSFVQHLPLAKRFHRPFAALMPLAFESFSLDEFDIILSVTSAEAKGVLTKPHQLHVCYLLTPTRYLWSHAAEYEADELTGWLRKPIFQYLRWWDETAALRPDVYIPISQLVAARCQTYYHRPTAPVIYPPVDLAHIKSGPLPLAIQHVPNYYLVVARLVPYKRIDLAIQACQQLGRQLVIIGDGPDRARLQQLAIHHANTRGSTTFLPAVQVEELGAYYSNCSGFLAPGEEDFGITVLEAQAAGRPVIVYRKSGGAEVVRDQHTGLHLATQTVAELATAMQQLEARSWSGEVIRQHVEKYNITHFHAQFRPQLHELWHQHWAQGGV